MVTKELKLTQQKISKRLLGFGINKNQQQVSEWFNGTRLPNIKVTLALSKILDIPMEELTKEFLQIYERRNAS